MVASFADNRISRLDEVEALSSEWIEILGYLGRGTVVTKNFNANNGMTLSYIGMGTGDGGDKYVGLDRFGRIIDQKWAEGRPLCIRAIKSLICRLGGRAQPWSAPTEPVRVQVGRP
jgi:hypothetical protein